MANRSPVSGIESLNSQIVKAAYRLCECHAIPSRKIEPSKPSIGKYGVSGNQEVLFLKIQADAPGGMSRGMEDFQGSDLVSFGEKPLCSDTGGSCAKMKGEAQMILEKARRIEVVDCNAGITHMRYLLQICSVIIVAVREHDAVYLPPVGFDRGRKNTGINKDGVDKIGIRQKPSSRDPRDWHA